MEYRAVVRDPSDVVELSATADRAFRLSASSTPVFSPLEEQVIALARTDRMGSLEEPGLIERFARFAFGLAPRIRTLADPRLEALRRAIVLSHHRHHLPDAQAADLLAVGFTPEQVGAIERRGVGG